MKIAYKQIAGLAALILILASCDSAKQVAYFQYSSSEQSRQAGTIIDTTVKTGQTAEVFEAKIKTRDLLSISVVSSNPDATRNFNLLAPRVSENTTDLYTQPTLQTYLVEKDGCINFPTLGKIKVAGLSRTELEQMLMQKLRPSFNEEQPVITIRICNYTVSVLGEVNRPGEITVTNDRVTILDAIAQSGDLTLYGKRDNIKVLREHADGSKEFLTANLNDRDIINSKAYYLEQNDVVYVEPNNVRKRTSSIGTAETLSISVVSTLISVASLVVNILR